MEACALGSMSFNKLTVARKHGLRHIPRGCPRIIRARYESIPSKTCLRGDYPNEWLFGDKAKEISYLLREVLHTISWRVAYV